MVALLEELLPWLLGFYLFDALAQLRRGQLLIVLEAMGNFRTLGSGLHFAGLMPWSTVLTAYDQPWIATVKGIWIFDSELRTTRPVVRSEELSFVSWEQLGDLRAQASTVKGAKRVLCRARSPEMAKFMAAELMRIRDAGDREAELRRQKDAAFDFSAARKIWLAVRRPAFVAGAFGTLVALTLFGALPVMIFSPRAQESAELWLAMGLALLVFHLGAVAFAALGLKRAGAGAAELSSTLLSLFIFPAYSARARGHVLRHALAKFEPTVIAAVLAPQDGFRRAAGREWVRLEESRRATPECAEYWDSRRQALVRVLREVGLTTEEVLRAWPLPEEAAAYCAVCFHAYRAGFTLCSDCEVPLRAAAGR